jgi:hypothetical protein
MLPEMDNIKEIVNQNSSEPDIQKNSSEPEIQKQ